MNQPDQLIINGVTYVKQSVDVEKYASMTLHQIAGEVLKMAKEIQEPRTISTEPKTTVTKYQAVIYDAMSGEYYFSNTLYSNEEEVVKSYGPGALVTLLTDYPITFEVNK